MSDTDMAFALRERCGCVVAVTVEDRGLHYVQTVAAWQRSAKACTIERITVEAAKDELGRTFAAERLRGRRHWRKTPDLLCRPGLVPPTPPAPQGALIGTDDAKAERALQARTTA